MGPDLHLCTRGRSGRHARQSSSPAGHGGPGRHSGNQREARGLGAKWPGAWGAPPLPAELHVRHVHLWAAHCVASEMPRARQTPSLCPGFPMRQLSRAHGAPQAPRSRLPPHQLQQRPHPLHPPTPLSSPENQRHEMSFSHTWLYFSVTALLFGKQKQFTKTKHKNPKATKHKASAAAWCLLAEAFCADSQMGQALPAFLCPESWRLTASSPHPQPQESWAEGHGSLWGPHSWGRLWVGKAPHPSLEHVTGCPAARAAQLGRSPEPSRGGLTRGPQTKGSKVSVHHQRQGQRHAACLPQMAPLLLSQPAVPGRRKRSRHHTLEPALSPAHRPKPHGLRGALCFRGEATCSEGLPRPCVPHVCQAGLQSGINKSTSKFLSSPFHIGFSVCACDYKNRAGMSYSSVFSKREHICVSARGSRLHIFRGHGLLRPRGLHSCGLRPARMTPRVQRQQNLSDLSDTHPAGLQPRTQGGPAY